MLLKFSVSLLVSLVAVSRLQTAQAWWLASSDSNQFIAPGAAAAAAGSSLAGSPSNPAAPAGTQPLASMIGGNNNNNNNNNHNHHHNHNQNEKQAPAHNGAPTAKKALAHFDNLDGVNGTFTFSQASPNEPTIIEYNLKGLRDNNMHYHVHVRPVPKFESGQLRNNASALAALCADPATGGHLNPHHITMKLPAKSAPFEQYETGDMSGKHGPLAKVDQALDRYAGSFIDTTLPMWGEEGIIGRSVVIHRNEGPRWVCASIVEVNSS